MISVRVRADAFAKEMQAKRQKIDQLRREGHAGAVKAYVEGSDEFPSISEIGALEADIEDLDMRYRAARNATEVLAGELSAVQSENRGAWIEVLKETEQKLLDRYMDVQRQVQQIHEDWRAHATMVESITGERQSLDFASPSRPILLKDPDTVVISTATAGAIT